MATRAIQKLRRWLNLGAPAAKYAETNMRRENLEQARREARKERVGKPGLLTYALLSEGLKKAAKGPRHPLRQRNRGDSVARRESREKKSQRRRAA